MHENPHGVHIHANIHAKLPSFPGPASQFFVLSPMMYIEVPLIDLSQIKSSPGIDKISSGPYIPPFDCRINL